MEIKATRLPPDVEYYLDNSCDEWTLSDAAHTVLRLFGDRGFVMRAVDEEFGSGAKGRSARGQYLEDYAHELMTGAPASLRDGYVAVALLSAVKHAGDGASVLADWNFVDSTIGGDLLPFRNRWRCDVNYRPFRRTRRQLYAPAAIRLYVKNSTDIVPDQRRRAQRFRCTSWPNSPAAARNILGLYDPQREAIRHRESLYAMSTALWRGASQKTDRLGDRKTRKVVRRSGMMAAAVLGAAAINTFSAGGAVEIRGQAMTFAVAKSVSIADVGHSALNIKIRSTDGEPLCSLCFYIDKTPALDQLAALAMFVEAGEEMDIFNTGNLYAIEPAGYVHPLIKERARQAPPVLALGRRTDIRDAARAYLADTLPIYTDAVLAQVWGGDKHRLLRWAAAA